MNIHLRLDKDFFYKMKKDKFNREEERGKNLTWENYIKLLFGFTQ